MDGLYAEIAHSFSWNGDCLGEDSVGMEADLLVDTWRILGGLMVETWWNDGGH